VQNTGNLVWTPLQFFFLVSLEWLKRR